MLLTERNQEMKQIQTTILSIWEVETVCWKNLLVNNVKVPFQKQQLNPLIQL